MKIRKITALLAAVSLSLSLLPFPAFAEDPEAVELQEYTGEDAASSVEGETAYENLSTITEIDTEDSGSAYTGNPAIIDLLPDTDGPVDSLAAPKAADQQEAALPEAENDASLHSSGYLGEIEEAAPEAYIPPEAYEEESLLGAAAYFPKTAVDIRANYSNNAMGVLYLPPVRNQGSGGTCWAFGSIATAEAYAIRKLGKYPAVIDYSEMALAYSSYHIAKDPLGGLTGDWNRVGSGNFISNGGSPRYAMNVLFQWCGVLPESLAPYNEKGTSFTLSDTNARKDDLHITEARYFNLSKNANEVKTWVSNYGAVTLSYYGDGAARGSKFYSQTYNSYYCPYSYNSNHTVAIVGWDDNFSRTNFSSVAGYPSKNGAWLIRNSWNDTGSNSFSADTYFWLSYEDKTITDTAVGARYEETKGATNRNNYQYDGSFIDCGISYSGANVFTCKSEVELLDSVAVGVHSANTDISVLVVKDFEDINDVLDYEADAYGDMSTYFAGMYTIKLNKTLTLRKGERYAVIAIVSDNSGRDQAKELTAEDTYSGNGYNSYASIKNDQSYIYYDGEFYDLANTRYAHPTDDSFPMGNLRIKAFTTTVSFTGVSLNSTSMTLYTGNEKQLKATTNPTTDPLASVRWSSSNTSVATVDEAGYVTAVKPGTAYIYAQPRGSSLKAQCTVTVKDPPIVRTSMYRMYNPNSGEHFYTASSGERDSLKRVGWKYEGIGWYAPSRSKTPVYRMYNPNAGDHHYTTSTAERDMLRRAGWNYEKIGWYSDDAKKVPLYRQYNPNARTGTHNYTISKAERDFLVRSGWKDEGIGWYGMK